KDSKSRPTNSKLKCENSKLKCEHCFLRPLSCRTTRAFRQLDPRRFQADHWTQKKSKITRQAQSRVSNLESCSTKNIIRIQPSTNTVLAAKNVI
ncbi:MAG: hypothetical protein MHM6MM_008680, partial [Cercozoa sp. M6MM]